MTKDKKYVLLESTVKEILLIAAMAEQDDGSIPLEDAFDGHVLDRWSKIKKRAIWLLQQDTV